MLIVVASLVHYWAIRKNVIVASQLYDVADVQFTLQQCFFQLCFFFSFWKKAKCNLAFFGLFSQLDFVCNFGRFVASFAFFKSGFFYFGKRPNEIWLFWPIRFLCKFGGFKDDFGRFLGTGRFLDTVYGQIIRADLKPMQTYWTPRHGVWLDCSFCQTHLALDYSVETPYKFHCWHRTLSSN